MSGLEMERVEDAAPSAPVTLFGTSDPREVVLRSTEIAQTLADVIRSRKLAVNIQNREYVLVEGWLLLGMMLGVVPETVWTRKLEDGWEARVEARTLGGQVMAGESQCTRSERTWAGREDFALRAMAQTRATSRALRPLGFVMKLAGYEAVAAEEMPVVEQAAPVSAPRSQFQPPPSVTGNGDTPTEKQLNLVQLLIDKLTKGGIVDATSLARGMQQEYGTTLVAELSKSQASDLIERLKAREAAAEATTAS